MDRRKTLCFIASAALIVVIMLGGLASLLRERLSLIYWRVRLSEIPLATGGGPYSVIEPSAGSGVSVRVIGFSEEQWKISHDWVPRTQHARVASNTCLITLGCWWDNSWQVSALPGDSNGRFLNAAPRNLDLKHGPLQNQITYQVLPPRGEHVISPPKIGNRGDGYFFVLEVGGIETQDPVVDTGQARKSHPSRGSGDPDSVQSLEVETEGTNALAGDLAVAIFSVDPHQNADMKIDLPAGWTSIGYNNVALQNIGFRACCKIVTTAGRQSVRCSWVDDSTFVAEATIVVFRSSPAAVQ